ncbi:MAG TPA: imidazole glycerol phosphate synthase subunit HisH [Oculatellaceae cyanobacterium]|jgi:imidazole glycerol phosphate synthase glutamine amidotransferase subunit
MIEVIDYGGGNLGSITRCLERLEVPFRMTTETNPPSGEYPVLFPGVGAFGSAMAHLTRNGLASRLQQIVRDGTPYLGICIGLQVLFEGSEEAPGIAGLGLLPGQVVKFRRGKIPQIGWNWVQSVHPNWESGYVYFVNSYYPQVASPKDALYTADYGGPFTAAVQKDNITAFQFHPEKSGVFGQVLIRQWIVQATK